jgi:hypothetical protein
MTIFYSQPLLNQVRFLSTFNAFSFFFFFFFLSRPNIETSKAGESARPVNAPGNAFAIDNGEARTRAQQCIFIRQTGASNLGFWIGCRVSVPFPRICLSARIAFSSTWRTRKRLGIPWLLSPSSSPSRFTYYIFISRGKRRYTVADGFFPHRA